MTTATAAILHGIDAEDTAARHLALTVLAAREAFGDNYASVKPLVAGLLDGGWWSHDINQFTALIERAEQPPLADDHKAQLSLVRLALQEWLAV